MRTWLKFPLQLFLCQELNRFHPPKMEVSRFRFLLYKIIYINLILKLYSCVCVCACVCVCVWTSAHMCVPEIPEAADVFCPLVQ